jgi:hypothetical protein
MRCSQLETRLNDALDRRENPLADDAIAAHVATCGRCRRVTAAYLALADGAAALGESEQADVARHPSSAVPAASSGRTFRPAAVAASWAVAAGLLLYVTLDTRTPDAGPLPANKKLADVATPAVPLRSAVRNASVVDLVRQPCRAYVDLVHGTARSVDEAIVIASSLPTPHELLAPVLFPEDGLLREIGDRWIPVADETLDALEQMFPAETTARS